ncbi:MAG: acyltransferase family protein [Oscillospiraceae bacterium]|nr:acyltransferase family protein [Oscillospiraceae bacterium]
MKRIEWIDSLKGFGIFCVTLGHLACNYFIETHIYSFHMFLFFFLSGFLHNHSQGNVKKFIAKKTKTILVPFLLWNLLSCLVGLLLGKSVYESVRLFFVLDGVMCWNGPIWFLLQLYIVTIIYFFVEKYIPYGKYLSIPILFVLWIFISENNIFLKLNILPVCLLFYILGNLFRQSYSRFSKAFDRKHKPLFLAALLLICGNILFGIVLNKRITFTGADFGNVFYCCLAAISGILFYLILFQKVPFLRTNRIFMYLGKNSLIIMATQYWFFTLYDAISERLFDFSLWAYRNTFKALIVCIVTILFICAIIEFLRKISVGNGRLRKICAWFGINLSNQA